jgi:3',5'-cyclic AMP phosphodiesterase CpdA
MPKKNETIRICHFSDLHLVPTQRVPLHKLFSKRILGYANLKLNRGRTHGIEHLRHLLSHVAKESADKIVVTGDFTSLSLDFEFNAIDKLFKEAGLEPARTMVIPGNHDRYTISADKTWAFERGLADWLPPNMSKISGYPLVEQLGPVVLFGLDTAVWRNPARAAGAISKDQIQRLRDGLTQGELRNRWPVIAMHHPPIYRGGRTLKHYRTGLSGFKRFIRTVNRPATVIHGHLHSAIRSREALIDIIGVPSASNNTGSSQTQFAYYVYTFSRDGLLKVEVNRFWPDATRDAVRHERLEL